MTVRHFSLLAALLAAGPAAASAELFEGWITDAECGADHAPMIAKGGMGKDDRECTLKCVSKGAPWGFVEAKTRTFYQLDDQEAPAPYAAKNVRIEGRKDGDTIYVKKILPAD